MIKKFVYLFLFLSLAVSGQQTINKLITKELTVQDKVEVTSTTKSSKPCPVMTETQRDAILSPATGSCVYNSNSLQLNVYDGTTWQEAGGGGISLWATGLAYDVNDVVIESDRIYRCLIAHTSGTFSTDLANGNWTEISEMQIVNLATGVTGILPIANGGTGSATQNFVDLTTNQTVAGEKTFSNTLKSDSIQTTGSSGVVIKNSSGTTVAEFGPANTTNASIAGGLNVGGNVVATGTVTGSNLSGTNTGDLTTGGDNDTPITTATIVAPNKQFTLTGTNQYRNETGNLNELQNANFEHSTVTTGWTVSNATVSGNTANPLEGKKSISLALTGALSLSQSSTINAAQKANVQMVASIWVNSSDVSDLQLCSLKNGAEDKCTVTGGYAQGSGWRQLTVSFLGDSTSNGLKLKSTDTTGTVLVDQAYVGIGSPVVDFTPDMVYSVKLSGTSFSDENISGWVSSVAQSGTNNQIKTLTIPSGIFSNVPNCQCTINEATTASDITCKMSVAASTATSLVFHTSNNGSAAAQNPIITCQKQGADYKTSKAYVASSSDYGRTAYTPTITGLGTVTNLDCLQSRHGEYLDVECSLTTGAVSASNISISLPSGLAIASNIPDATTGYALVGQWARGATSSLAMTVIAAPAGTTVFASLYGGGTRGAITPAFGTDVGSSEAQSFRFRVPIQGWTDSGVIVGSFQGYNETPGTSRVETFSVSYGTTAAGTVCSASPCSYLDQIGTNFSSITRSTNGDYTMNLSKTYSKLKCTASVLGASTLATVASGGGTIGLNCTNCNSMRFLTGNPAVAYVDTFGTIMCQGIPQ